jgi:pyruvate/2-oxoglutarate dehydrogenase complex dihydrolipoamide dehydrogenase (E3) component
MTPSFDITIIGGGSAGYAAARTALSLGAKVAVIDGAQELGGLCILRGCMPTKALLESSRRWFEIRHAKEFGLLTKPIKPDLTAIMRRKKVLIDDFASYRQQQLTSGKFTLFRAHAQFLSPTQIQLDDGKKKTIIDSKSTILATGSKIEILPIPGLEKTAYLTSDTALTLQKLPPSIIVLGGGAIALEFAQFFSDLGTKVTVIQRSPHLIRDFDPDLAIALQNALEKQGVRFFTETELVRIEKSAQQKTVHFKHRGKPTKVSASEVFYGLGRSANIHGLGLEIAGVKMKSGKPSLNRRMQTSQKNIFAAGDVAGLYEVVHIAIQQGEIAAKNAVALLKRKPLSHHFDDRLKTTVIFTHPEVAQVGANEKELAAAKIPFKTAQYPFADHGKSMIHGETDGFMKLISDPKTGKILGGSIIGPHASELIHEIIAVMYFNGTARDIALIPHYHPTLAEMITYPAEELAGM